MSPKVGAMIAVAAIAAIVVGAIGYFAWENQLRPAESIPAIPQAQPSDWKQFRESQNGFSFSYPPDFSIEDLGKSNYCLDEIGLQKDSSYMTVCVSTPDSIAAYDAGCAGFDAECYLFRPLSCETSTTTFCSEMVSRALSEVKKAAVFWNNDRSSRIEFDDRSQSEDLPVFDKIVSTFIFNNSK